MLMPIYTAHWEWKLATQDQRQIAAEQVRVARALWMVSEDKQQVERPRSHKPTLKRLLMSLRYAAA